MKLPGNNYMQNYVRFFYFNFFKIKYNKLSKDNKKYCMIYNMCTCSVTSVVFNSVIP